MLYGQSYFDYIMRTPPAFLGTDRPEDLALQMDVYGIMMAQGGIFEVAEAYWNFGLVGAFIVPFILTKFLAFLLEGGLKGTSNSFFYYVTFLSFSLMMPRGIWYQTFASWRLITICIIFTFIYLLYKTLILKAK